MPDPTPHALSTCNGSKITVMNYNPNFDPGASPMTTLKPRSNAPWVMAFLALAGAAAGGYYLHQGRQHARQDAAEAAQRAQAAEAAKTGELEQLKGTYDKLEDKMKDEIAKGDIRLSQSGGRLRVDLVDKILFDSGEAVISKRGEGVLARVGAVLATMDDKQIQVSGHTDSNPISEKLAPQFPTNWELSVTRAVNVVRFLEEKANVPAKNLTATGYGQYHPIASNKTAAGRARNRRIEILLTPSLEPKAMSKCSRLRAAVCSRESDAASPVDPPAVIPQ